MSVNFVYVGFKVQSNGFNSTLIVRFIPAFFPGAKFQKQAAQSRDTLARFWNTPFERVVEQMVRNLVYLGWLST